MTSTQSESELVRLWERHYFEHDSEAREQLVIYYAPLVSRVVGRLGIPPSPTLEYQDLIGYGIAGLLEAIDRYNPQRGNTFESFATQRIRGAVIDALRRLDYVPRSVRRRIAQIQAAIAELRQITGRIPTDEEVAHHLGMGLHTYQEVMSQANFVFLSLDSPFVSPAGDEGEVELGEAVEDTTMTDMMVSVEQRDLHRELVEAIQELPEREQLILSLYYYEGLTVREIADVLEICPSRVSQLMSRAIMTLRARLVYDLGPQESRRRDSGSQASRRPGFAPAANGPPIARLGERYA